jgi:hypothetical protein
MLLVCCVVHLEGEASPRNCPVEIASLAFNVSSCQIAKTLTEYYLLA